MKPFVRNSLLGIFALAAGVAVSMAIANDTPSINNGETTTPETKKAEPKPEKPITQPELSENAYKILNHFDIHEADLQFDKVRTRDHRGLDVCEDADKNGIADAYNDGTLIQNTWRFSSIIIDDKGKQHFAKKQSRGDFIKSMETHGNATGILAIPENDSITVGGKVFPVMFAVREDGETKVSRLQADKKIGNLENIDFCTNLDIKDFKKDTSYYQGKDAYLKRIP